MKGLDLCEQYFSDIGLPIFEKECSELLPKMAIGLVGDGSDCFGYDDHISRDHDWGPGFCIWLGKSDIQAFGYRIQKVYDSLPGNFRGFSARLTSQWGTRRVGVLGIDEFLPTLFRNHRYSCDT